MTAMAAFLSNGKNSSYSYESNVVWEINQYIEICMDFRTSVIPGTKRFKLDAPGAYHVIVT